MANIPLSFAINPCEHGVCARKVAVEELFAPEVQTFTRV